MKILFFISLFTSITFAFSLKEYVYLSLNDSNDAKLIEDVFLNYKYDYDLQKNQFSGNYSPASSFSMNEDSNNLTIGLIREQQNIYGGNIYGKMEILREESDNEENSYTPKFSIGYKQSLFQKFGEKYNTLALDRSKDQLNLFKLIKQDTQADIIIKATLKYYTYTLNKVKIDIQEQSVQRALNHYEAAKAKYKSGIVSKIDVHRAKLSYLDQKKNLKESIKLYHDSLEELYFYINQTNPNDNLETNKITALRHNIQTDSENDLLESNIRWQEILLNEEYLDRELYNLKKDFLPDIELGVDYSRYSSDEKLSKSFDLNEDQWSLGLSSSYNFNTTSKKINYNKKKIEIAKHKRDKDALKREILKNIKSLKNELTNTKENLEIYDLKRTESRNSLDVAQVRYNRGLSTNLDILDAEAIYSNSQIDYMSELVKHNITLLKLVKEYGYLNDSFIEENYGQ